MATVQVKCTSGPGKWCAFACGAGLAGCEATRTCMSQNPYAISIDGTGVPTEYNLGSYASGTPVSNSSLMNVGAVEEIAGAMQVTFTFEGARMGSDGECIWAHGDISEFTQAHQPTNRGEMTLVFSAPGDGDGGDADGDGDTGDTVAPTVDDGRCRSVNPEEGAGYSIEMLKAGVCMAKMTQATCEACTSSAKCGAEDYVVQQSCESGYGCQPASSYETSCVWCPGSCTGGAAPPSCAGGGMGGYACVSNMFSCTLAGMAYNYGCPSLVPPTAGSAPPVMVTVPVTTVAMTPPPTLAMTIEKTTSGLTSAGFVADTTVPGLEALGTLTAAPTVASDTGGGQTISMVFDGDLSTIDEATQTTLKDSIKDKVATAAGVVPARVTVTLAPGSVLATAVISGPAVDVGTSGPAAAASPLLIMMALAAAAAAAL